MFIFHLCGTEWDVENFVWGECRRTLTKTQKVGRPKKFNQGVLSTSSQPSSCTVTSTSSQLSSSYPSNKLQTLANDLALPSKQWIVQMLHCKVTCNWGCHDSDSFPCCDKKSLMDAYCPWKEVNPDKCSALTGIPTTLSSATLQSLLSVLDKAAVCSGHLDQQFLSMLDAKKRTSCIKKLLMWRVTQWTRLSPNCEIFIMSVSQGSQMSNMCHLQWRIQDFRQGGAGVCARKN